MRASDGSCGIPVVAVPVRASVTGAHLVGEAAAIMARMEPEALVHGFTRQLGRSHGSPEPEHLTGLLLEHLADSAATLAGARPRRAVFAVPDGFDMRAPGALVRAAVRGGLSLQSTICDATARALVGPEARTRRRRQVVIVDLGAGAIRASVLLVSSGEVILQGRGGDPMGGDEVDRVLAELTLIDLGDDGRTISGRPRSRCLLRRAVDEMRRELADPSVDRARAALDHDGRRVKIALTRDRLAAVLEDCGDRIAAAVRRALAEANVRTAQVEAAYVAGGMNAQLRGAVARIFPRARVAALHEDSAAMGAAVQSAALLGEAPPVEIVDARGLPGLAGRCGRPGGATVVRETTDARRPLTDGRVDGAIGHHATPAPLRGAAESARTLEGDPPTLRRPPRIARRPPMCDGVLEVVRVQLPAPPATPPTTPDPPTRRRHVAHPPPRARLAPEPFLPWRAPAAVNPPAARPSRSGSMRAARPPTPPASGEHPVVAVSSPPPTLRSASRPPAAQSIAGAPPPVLAQAASGELVRPPDAAALVALPCADTCALPDPSRVALPVLLARLLADVAVTGTLTLERRGSGLAEMRIEEGHAVMSAWQHRLLLDAFAWPDGVYRFEPCATGKLPRRGPRPVSLMSFVVEGLRTLTRTYEVEAIEGALGDRLDLAPVVAPEREPVLGHLGLTGLERRLMEISLDGSTPGRALIELGRLGRETVVGLFVILTVFDAIAWTEVRAAPQVSQDDELARRAAKMDGLNHFLAMGLHWSSLSEEIDARYEALMGELVAPNDASPAAQVSVARMRSRVEAAYAILADPSRRKEYRLRVYPLDYEAIAGVATERAKHRALRADAGDASWCQAVATELVGSPDPAPDAPTARSWSVHADLKPAGPAARRSRSGS